MFSAFVSLCHLFRLIVSNHVRGTSRLLPSLHPSGAPTNAALSHSGARILRTKFLVGYRGSNRAPPSSAPHTSPTMRNLLKTEQSSFWVESTTVPDAPISASTWDVAHGQLICAFGPSEGEGLVELSRVSVGPQVVSQLNGKVCTDTNIANRAERHHLLGRPQLRKNHLPPLPSRLRQHLRNLLQRRHRSCP